MISMEFWDMERGRFIRRRSRLSAFPLSQLSPGLSLSPPPPPPVWGVELLSSSLEMPLALSTFSASFNLAVSEGCWEEELKEGAPDENDVSVDWDKVYSGNTVGGSERLEVEGREGEGEGEGGI
jgi:hypothetical protein